MANNTGNDAKGKFPEKEEIEDVCFVCKDGGKLIVCDYENCGKVYHPDCLNKEDSFFDNVDYWVCDRHYCCDCKKTPEFYCLGCPKSMCRKCFGDSDFLILKGIKGLCFYCFQQVEIILFNLEYDAYGGILQQRKYSACLES
ncbi:zinc finger CCCH domain-containing protein 44-like [Lotus japonicus]|uniref:zinc finger CCCH domain-containing protein 44-like n=1 Tax=Lotus japonicus TaxID=34305 RepID=UPI002590BE85|nr:zinc finger CCCH domain-containing protein 44-like [Lotus japonicus]